MFMFRNIYSISLSGSSLAGLIKRRYESLRLVLLLSKISICCSFLIPQALLCPWNHESLRFILPYSLCSLRDYWEELLRSNSALFLLLRVSILSESVRRSFCALIPLCPLRYEDPWCAVCQQPLAQLTSWAFPVKSLVSHGEP